VGQQQLLILVLGLLIVSLAVFIGIDLFDRSMKQRHVDLLVNHTVMVASEAISWRTRESPFLGGGESYAELDTDGMAQIIMNEVRPPGIGVLTRVVGTEIVETRIAYDGSIAFPGGTE
jgi:hypothetical protein